MFTMSDRILPAPFSRAFATVQLKSLALPQMSARGEKAELRNGLRSLRRQSTPGRTRR